MSERERERERAREMQCPSALTSIHVNPVSKSSILASCSDVCGNHWMGCLFVFKPTEDGIFFEEQFSSELPVGVSVCRWISESQCVFGLDDGSICASKAHKLDDFSLVAAHAAGVTSLHALKGNKVISTSVDGSVICSDLDLDDYQTVWSIPPSVGHCGSITASAVVDSVLFTAGSDRRIRAWNAKDGTPLELCATAAEVVSKITVVSNEVVVLGDVTGAVSLLRRDDNRWKYIEESIKKLHSSQITDFAVVDGSAVLSSGIDGRVVLFEIVGSSVAPSKVVHAVHCGVHAIAFGNAKVYMGCSDGKLIALPM
eukprot:ANDGO_00046.mRNA.1 hypothetical protein